MRTVSATQSLLRKSLPILVIVLAAFSSAQGPARRTTVAFATVSLQEEKESIAKIRTLADRPGKGFEDEVRGRGLRWKQLAPALRVVWDPAVALETKGDPAADLARCLDTDLTARFDALPPFARQGVLASVSKAPSVGGATFGTPAPDLRVKVTAERNIFLRSGGRTLDLNLAPATDNAVNRRLVESMRYGPPPDERELARWRQPSARPYEATPSVSMDLGTTAPETYAVVFDEVTRFLREETARNLVVRRRAQSELLRKLVGDEEMSVVQDSRGERPFKKLPVELRDALEKSVGAGYRRHGFGSEAEALQWLSGATLGGQYVRVMVDFASAGGPTPLFFGFEAFPAIAVP